MASDIDSALQSWLSLAAVQALFGADLPWYASKLNQIGLPETGRSSIQNFRDRFRFDVDLMSLLLRPEEAFSHLSKDTAKELEMKLDTILLLFESRIDNEVLNIQSRCPKTDKDKGEPPVEGGITSVFLWPLSGIRHLTATSKAKPQAYARSELSVKGTYPKLKALNALLESLDNAIDPVFKYGNLINLGQNQDEYKKVLKELEQFTEFLASLDDAKRSSLPTQKSPINSVEISRVRYASCRLHDALVHIPTECRMPHKAMLHLTGFKQSGVRSLQPAYDMFLSCCMKPFEQQEEWQESHCVVSDPLDYPGATSISKICFAIQSLQQTRGALRLMLGGENLFEVCAGGGHLEYPEFSHRISLGTLLDKGYFKSVSDGGLFTSRSKRLLLVNLARCLLFLFDTDWLQQEWQASDLFFLCGAGGDHLVDMHRPYILNTLSLAHPRLCEVKDGPVVPHHPSILSFAKLLVEIERGRRITSGERELSAGYENQWLTISTILSRQLSGSLTGNYENAVQSCLDFARPTGYGSKSQVDYIHQNIVMPLESELAAYREAQLENVNLQLPCTIPSSTTTTTITPLTYPVRTMTSLAHHPPIPSTPILQPPLLSRPGRTMTQISNPTSTVTWFQQMANFNYLLKAADDDVYMKVKIAVLDTGVDPRDPVADYISGYTDLVSGNNNVKCDNTGHGTTSINLIFDMCEPAEVYVFRIFDTDIANDNTEEMAIKAIELCVKEKMDVICMACGFSKFSQKLYEIVHTASLHTLIFAAPTNESNAGEIAYPAKHHELVFCMYSTNSDVRKSARLNPSQGLGNYNFAILGEDIRTFNGERRSGTSFSTAIAAGLAGRLLDFSRHKDSQGSIPDVQNAYAIESRLGMTKILLAMSMVDGPYHCLRPWKLLPQNLRKEIASEGFRLLIGAERQQARDHIRNMIKLSLTNAWGPH